MRAVKITCIAVLLALLNLIPLGMADDAPLPAPSATAPVAAPAATSPTVVEPSTAPAVPPPLPDAGSGAGEGIKSPTAAPAKPTVSEIEACLAGRPANLCGGDLPLMLDTVAVRLPVGRAGKTYRHQIGASGGVPPYRFQIAGGDLPEGLQMSATGLIDGTPLARDQQRFTVQVTDWVGQIVQQGYLLAVVASGGKAKAKPETPVPQATKAIVELPAVEAKALLQPAAQIEVYRLTDELIKSIADPITDPTDLVTRLKSDERGQVKQLLAPLVGVEYPGRRLFAAALNDRVCAYSAELFRAAALRRKMLVSKEVALASVCPFSANAPPAAASAPAPAAAITDAVPIDRLPAAVLPEEWRTLVIERARLPATLPVTIADFGVPGWEGQGCNCLAKATKGSIYGFYPAWHDGQTSPKVDFGVYDRISLFAQMIDGQGNIAPPLTESAHVLSFLHQAHAHGSELDIALYQGDWRFLNDTAQTRQDEAIQQLAEQAVRQADLPVPGWQGRWRRWLPGDGFGEVERVAGGITLYLAPPDDKDLKLPFARFRDRLIRQLIRTLRTSPYPHTLNLMVDDSDLVSSKAAAAGKERTAIGTATRTAIGLVTPGSTQVGTAELFDYLLAAEDPTIVGGRIANGGGEYASNTGVTLRYIVLMAEPVAASGRRLRQVIEDDPELLGINQKIVMRKLIPLVSAGSGSREQFDDNLAYFVDNFGGVALWQPPAEIPRADAGNEAEHGEPQATVTSDVIRGLRATFLADEPAVGVVCSWTCEWHLPLRVLFFLLLVVGLLSFTLYLVCCRIRALGTPYKLYLLGGCVLTLVVGAALLQCDPGLQTLRENNHILYGVLAGLLLFTLIPLLKPRVEKP